MMKELYDRIQIELDKHRVDEWHSVIPLSEDGSSILENLSEVSYPNRLSGANGLFLHQDEQSSIEPTNAYTKTAYTVLMEDNDYIYNIFLFFLFGLVVLVIVSYVALFPLNPSYTIYS